MERITYRRNGGSYQLEVPCRGADVLRHPLCNKGSAFTREDRERLELEGLLPFAVSPMELQAERIYRNILRKSDPLERYIGMAALQDRNEHLFYRVLLDHIEELLPIVYTPTVGQASKEYSRIFRRGRGVFLTPAHRGQMGEVLRRACPSGIRLIVATDNEAILGLGDQGAGGMVIPIGKLAIYSAAAGIHPVDTLPVSLDVGTDNQELLEDELYIGWRAPRLRGEEYLAFVDEFVAAVEEVYPQALVQWEDFHKETALEILDRYRHRLLSFNDDVQGTGAVTLAGLMAASRASGLPFEEQRVVLVGAGAAGTGIARQLRIALAEAGVGVEERLRGAIAVLDSRGLLVDDRPGLDRFKTELAWPAEMAAREGLGPDSDRSLLGVVRALSPTALVGISGQKGMFTEEVVRAMAAAVERPAIFPFSNPTDNSEATPEDLLAWTGGRALVATGSPFPAVTLGATTVQIGQGNNAFIFPAVGLGALVAGAREVTPAMFTAAARALAAEVDAAELGRGRLFPPVSALREVTARVAAAVVATAREEGVAPQTEGSRIAQEVAAAMWEPDYPELIPV
jgi:malate dehydrogenase (oxaloacetate-decarboxylating)